ncbi:MAG: addiction module toxin RelE [Gammaproteobacteria bacterium]|nr:MAG: addiction module toxin RelE [Gammaproteobacteria bacterium]
MARPLRIEYAGALYHVTSRGDRREDIYFEDDDREIWLALFAQVCSRFNWRCHAWCLMDNHYHIVIETIEGNLSQGMRQLNGVYTQQSNRKHGLFGHLFQGRYKAILVEKDSYLLELSRYVVLNPIRAGIVKNMGDWQWSSYPAMIGDRLAPEWLETDWLLSQFGKSRKVARNHYINFVREGIGLPPVWKALKSQIYLGDKDFVENMQTIYDQEKNGYDLKEIPRLQRKPIGKPLSWYDQTYEIRDQAMAQAYFSGDYTMKEISVWFKVHYSTVSRAVKKGENA